MCGTAIAMPCWEEAVPPCVTRETPLRNPMRRTRRLVGALRVVWPTLLMAFAATARAADTVPADIQQPGTQPNEVGNLETPDKCDNCHGGYDAAVEPAHNWRGSMMANAGRDPIFWATVAIAEQDFDGAGDLCIRCHSTGGWLAGRSTPTDGSATGEPETATEWSAASATP